MLNKEKATIEEQAALFGVLADQTRLKLLRLLLQQREPDALCVNALAYCLGVTQPDVSQHLKVLKSAGIVKGQKRGYRVHYFVNRDTLDKAQAMISIALRFEDGEITGSGPGDPTNESK